MLKMKTINILFYVLILVSFTIYSQENPKIVEKEIKTSPTIDFLNRTIVRASETTRQKDINTGKKLAELISKIPSKIHSVNKVNLQRITPSSKSFGGDIITIAPEKNFGHINRFHRILNGYVQEGFGYSEDEAELIAKYIIYYNGLHRKNIEYFQKKFTNPVLDQLNSKYVGISTNYKEWAGQTQIVIPIEFGVTGDNRKEIQLEELREEVKKIIESKPGGDEIKKKFDDIIETKIKKDQEVLKEEKEEVAKLEDDTKKKAEEVDKKLEDLKKDPEANKDEIEKVEKEKEELEKEVEELEAKKDEIQEKEDILVDKQQDPGKEEEVTEKDEVETEIPKDEEAEAVAKLDTEEETTQEEPPKPETPEEKLERVEKELEETKEELQEKIEEEKKKNEFSPNVVENKIVFLKTTKYLDKGHYNNEIHLIDPENDDTILKSSYNNICGKDFQIFNKRILVLGYNDTHENSHKLALLSQNDLKFQEMSKVYVFWRTPMIIRKNDSGEEELYAFEEDEGRYFLARFDKDLKRVARSNEEINPNSSVTFFGSKIYITAKEDSANQSGIQVLTKDELKTIKRIQP